MDLAGQTKTMLYYIVGMIGLSLKVNHTYRYTSNKVCCGTLAVQHWNNVHATHAGFVRGIESINALIKLRYKGVNWLTPCNSRGTHHAMCMILN